MVWMLTCKQSRGIREWLSEYFKTWFSSVSGQYSISTVYRNNKQQRQRDQISSTSQYIQLIKLTPDMQWINYQQENNKHTNRGSLDLATGVVAMHPLCYTTKEDDVRVHGTVLWNIEQPLDFWLYNPWLQIQ